MTTYEKLCILKEKGVSLTYLAKMVGCAPQTITQWALGSRAISQRLEKDLEIAIVEYVKSLEELKNGK